VQTSGRLHNHYVPKCHQSAAGLRRKHACSEAHCVYCGEICIYVRQSHDPVCPSRDGEHAPQRPAEKQPTEVTSAGTRPVLPCIVCVSTTRCCRHHGNVVSACMHSPCNFGLSRRLSYITKAWFGMRYVGRTHPCFCIAAGSPNVIWHLYLPVVLHQHEPNNASARVPPLSRLRYMDKKRKKRDHHVQFSRPSITQRLCHLQRVMARAEPAKDVLCFGLRASAQIDDESIQQVTLSL